MIDALFFTLKLVISFVIINLLTVHITTIYLHRYKTHRAFEMIWWLAGAMKTTIWLLTGIDPREWVGVHLKHHAHADKDGDPHSPWIYGFWNIQIWNVIYYDRQKKKLEEIERYVKHMPYGPLDHLFFRHALLGVGMGLAICYLLAEWAGVIAYVLSGLVYVFYESSTINAPGHWPTRFGQRNYDDEHTAQSYNIHWPGWLDWVLNLGTGGEKEHNNHHATPGSARFDHYPERGDKDSGGVVIGWLERRGWIWNVKDLRPHAH